MNSTFMFGEDRFSESEDFSAYCHGIGGRLTKVEINTIIRAVYDYLDVRYIEEAYRHSFPSVESVIKNVIDTELPQIEINNIINTFAYHELGHIPDEYVAALRKLRNHFVLAVVIDIWSPKNMWLNTFKRAGIDTLFSAASFSSDHGMVKPSAKPFELVLNQLALAPDEALVIGDSVRRDLGGASAAGIDCILVGGAVHPQALASYENLLEFCRKLNE